MLGPKSGVHGKTCVVREGTEVRRSCAAVPSAFRPCGFDVGLHGVSTELDGQGPFGLFNVGPLLHCLYYRSFVLTHFPSLVDQEDIDTSSESYLVAGSVWRISVG